MLMKMKNSEGTYLMSFDLRCDVDLLSTRYCSTAGRDLHFSICCPKSDLFLVGLYILCGRLSQCTWVQIHVEGFRLPYSRLAIPSNAEPPGVTHSDSHHHWQGTVVKLQWFFRWIWKLRELNKRSDHYVSYHGIWLSDLETFRSWRYCGTAGSDHRFTMISICGPNLDV